MSGTNLLDLLSAIQLELSKLLLWLQANKLTLNVCKTHYMVFDRARINTINICDISLNIDSASSGTCSIFLGIVIELQSLNYKVCFNKSIQCIYFTLFQLLYRGSCITYIYTTSYYTTKESNSYFN